MEERYVDKLAKYILLAAGVAMIGGLCWYFRSVLIYILIAVVVSLVAKYGFVNCRYKGMSLD